MFEMKTAVFSSTILCCFFARRPKEIRADNGSLSVQSPFCARSDIDLEARQLNPEIGPRQNYKRKLQRGERRESCYPNSVEMRGRSRWSEHLEREAGVDSSSSAVRSTKPL